MARLTIRPSTTLEAFGKAVRESYAPPSFLWTQLLPRGWRVICGSRTLLRRAG
jgi:hypothetical protein